MNDLQRLIDHPPQDPEPPAQPRFTAAVMARVRTVDVAVRAPVVPRQKPLWPWWVAGLAVAGLIAVPGTSESGLGFFAFDLAALAEPLLELLLVSSLVALAVLMRSHSNVLRSRHG